MLTQYPLNRQKATSWLYPVIALFLFFFPIIGKADEGTLNFHVTPEFPQSQIEGSDRYFDLNLNPGQTESLTLTLQNASNEPIRIQVTPHTAYTNVHGVVEYGKDATEPDNTLSHTLDALIEPTDIIELAGNETKTVTVPIHMPTESFEGFLAGGLRVQEVKEEQEEAASTEEGVAIKNEFAYVIGVVISNTRDSVQPDLNLVDVFADQLNYRNVISANLQNTTSTFINRLAVEAKIQREGEEEVLYQANEEQMQMAPNSNFNFPISLEGDRFQAGNYVLTLKAVSGEEEWEWTRPFTIDGDQARALNQQDVTIDTSINWWFIGASLLILVLFAIIIYLIVQKKRSTEKEQPN
nr:DUF916 and DUF3324 domain-containing protein [Enterococcus spodopteracolus]